MKLLLDFHVHDKAGCYRFRIIKKMSVAPIQKYIDGKKDISNKTIKALNKAAQAEVSKIIGQLVTIQILSVTDWSIYKCLILLPEKTSLKTYPLSKKSSVKDLANILKAEGERQDFDWAEVEHLDIDYYYSIPKKLRLQLASKK